MARTKRFHPRGNTTLMTLLKMGCLIEFDNQAQTALWGDPQNKYIEMKAHGHNQGVYSLNDGGLVAALDDLEEVHRDYEELGVKG